ncbi:hypothetical protein [Dokdonia donghaensis]|uniref:Lipocalin-like domain-containing protein n=1 Tax=Dokdonia donghaensis DSW-1 TaxID=1300343 RepID=A0A0A2H3J7_9FLAO|nr:hypothetical protein [Dokdonia donghaensis]ANH59893.1 hypothetical protein I597_0968 [Dokdonia donghaensis DSW-1]KGO07215.1 hypothetical protein NV36_10475 [Dokdonia donghaensis DSW-1]
MKTFVLVCLYVMGATLLTSDGLINDKSDLTLEGVWELENQQMYENGMISETLPNQNGYRQVKMYSKGRVMWTRNDPSDANEWFGYGTYKVKDGILEERLEYASGPMMKIVDTTQVFRFELLLGANTYQQRQMDDEGNPTEGESYKRLE